MALLAPLLRQAGVLPALAVGVEVLPRPLVEAGELVGRLEEPARPAQGGLELLEGRLALVAQAQAAREIGISQGALSRIEQGRKSARPAENLARLDVLLAQLTVLPFTDAAARHFGSLRAQLEREGRRLNDLDLQIGSTALAEEALLLTHNLDHFGRIPGLRAEDWLAASGE